MNYKFVPAISNTWLNNYYDPLTNLFGVGSLLQEKTSGLVTLEEGQSILDIGCGTGTLSILLKEKFPMARIVAIDPDEYILNIAINKAKRKNLEVEYVKATAEKLPFPKAAFDFVVSSLTFHHLPTEIKKQAFKEILRVLKSDGIFLLVDIGKPKNLFWKIVLYIVEVVLIETREYIKDNLAGNIPSLMKEAGFKVTEARKSHTGIQFWRGEK